MPSLRRRLVRCHPPVLLQHLPRVVCVSSRCSFVCFLCVSVCSPTETDPAPQTDEMMMMMLLHLRSPRQGEGSIRWQARRKGPFACSLIHLSLATLATNGAQPVQALLVSVLLEGTAIMCSPPWEATRVCCCWCLLVSAGRIWTDVPFSPVSVCPF